MSLQKEVRQSEVRNRQVRSWQGKLISYFYIQLRRQLRIFQTIWCCYLYPKQSRLTTVPWGQVRFDIFRRIRYDRIEVRRDT